MFCEFFGCKTVVISEVGEGLILRSLIELHIGVLSVLFVVVSFEGSLFHLPEDIVVKLEELPTFQRFVPSGSHSNGPSQFISCLLFLLVPALGPYIFFGNELYINVIGELPLSFRIGADTILDAHTINP